MAFWEKRRDPQSARDAARSLVSSQILQPRGVARAALEGASPWEILQEALHELRSAGDAERLGIWMAGPHDAGDASSGDALGPSTPPTSGRPDAPPVAGWRGLAWDWEISVTPREWEQLSAEAPIPQDVLLGVRAVEQQFEAASNRLLISILIGMRRALWTPIAGRGRVLGVILCAASQHIPASLHAAAARLAAELALQVAWKQERSVARERYSDLSLARRLHSQLNAEEQPSALLANLTDSIVASPRSEGGSDPGLGAAFACIGVLRSVPAAQSATREPLPGGPVASDCTAAPSPVAAEETFAVPPSPPPSAETTAPASHFLIDFRWKSGDPDWLRLTEGDTFAATCQNALRDNRTTGIEPAFSWMPARVARVVAVPIRGDGQLCGVLLAGLSRADASLGTLERLESRAMLAGVALARLQRERHQSLALRRLHAQLSASGELLVILDERGCTSDLSAAAAELLRETRERAAAQAAKNPADPQAVLAGSAAAASERETTLPVRKSATPPTAVSDARQPNRFHRDPAFVSDEAIGQPFPQLFRPADRAAIAAWLVPDSPAHDSRWNSASQEFAAELPGGQRVRLRRALPTATGGTVITMKKLAGLPAPEKTSAAEQTLQGVIEWLEEGVLLFDAHGRVRVSNTRFAQFAGWPSRESVTGATVEDLLARMGPHAGDPAAFAERWRSLARGFEGGVRDELRMTRPTPRILERASRPVLDAAGHTLGRLEIYRDLTAQRVFQSQLLQTEKLAALGQMITGVAHELSNPLTSILGYAQRLLLRDDPAARSTEVRQIFLEAERASGILRQLLFTAREAPPERRRVALNQVVMRSMELQRFSLAAEKSASSWTSTPPCP